jgi:hypothetical protein
MIAERSPANPATDNEASVERGRRHPFYRDALKHVAGTALRVGVSRAVADLIGQLRGDTWIDGKTMRTMPRGLALWFLTPDHDDFTADELQDLGAALIDSLEREREGIVAG